jgi:hypothetical protein
MPHLARPGERGRCGAGSDVELLSTQALGFEVYRLRIVVRSRRNNKIMKPITTVPSTV